MIERLHLHHNWLFTFQHNSFTTSSFFQAKQTQKSKLSTKCSFWRNENIFSTASSWFWKVHIKCTYSASCSYHFHDHSHARAILLECCTFVDLRIFADWGNNFQQTNASQNLCYCSLSFVNLKMYWNNYSIQNMILFGQEKSRNFAKNHLTKRLRWSANFFANSNHAGRND